MTSLGSVDDDDQANNNNNNDQNNDSNNNDDNDNQGHSNRSSRLSRHHDPQIPPSRRNCLWFSTPVEQDRYERYDTAVIED